MADDAPRSPVRKAPSGPESPAAALLDALALAPTPGAAPRDALGELKRLPRGDARRLRAHDALLSLAEWEIGDARAPRSAHTPQERARALCALALEQAPDSGRALLLAADVAMRQGRFGTAAVLFTRAAASPCGSDDATVRPTADRGRRAATDQAEAALAELLRGVTTQAALSLEGRTPISHIVGLGETTARRLAGDAWAAATCADVCSRFSPSRVPPEPVPPRCGAQYTKIAALCHLFASDDGAAADAVLDVGARAIVARIGCWNVRARTNLLSGSSVLSRETLNAKAANLAGLIAAHGWSAVALQEVLAPAAAFVGLLGQHLGSAGARWAVADAVVEAAAESAVFAYDGAVWEPLAPAGGGAVSLFARSDAPFKRPPALLLLRQRDTRDGSGGSAVAPAAILLALVSVHLKSKGGGEGSGGGADALAQTRREASQLGAVAAWACDAAAAAAAGADCPTAVLLLGDFNLAAHGTARHAATDGGDAWTGLAAAGFARLLPPDTPTNLHEALAAPDAARCYDNVFFCPHAGAGGCGDARALVATAAVVDILRDELADVRAAVAAARARAGGRRTRLVDEFFGDGERGVARVFRDRAFREWSDHRPLSITLQQRERQQPPAAGEEEAGSGGSGAGGSAQSARHDAGAVRATVADIAAHVGGLRLAWDAGGRPAGGLF